MSLFRLLRYYWLILFLIGSFSEKSFSQDLIKTSEPLPRQVLYRHFLGYINFLDIESQNNPASSSYLVQEEYRKQIGFNHEQFSQLRTSAKIFQSVLRAQDLKAQTVIEKFRKQLAGTVLCLSMN